MSLPQAAAAADTRPANSEPTDSLGARTVALCKPENLKGAAARFVSGVTIVVSGREGRIHGATVSAFSCVSLDPPLVLVCLSQRSSLVKLIKETDAFTVNVLSSGQSHISDMFAKPGRRPVTSLSALSVSHRIGATGVPVIEGTSSYFECEVHSMQQVGDHTVFVGSVVHAEASGETPLVYFDRAYRAILT